jgi:Trk K+ transport system NAD-binding subunit
MLRRWTTIDTQDYHALLRLSADYAVRQYDVHAGGHLDGRAIAELLPRAHRVVLLGIERADGTYLGAPDPSEVLRGGDTLTVYGRDEVLETLAARSG